MLRPGLPVPKVGQACSQPTRSPLTGTSASARHCTLQPVAQERYKHALRAVQSAARASCLSQQRRSMQPTGRSLRPCLRHVPLTACSCLHHSCPPHRLQFCPLAGPVAPAPASTGTTHAAVCSDTDSIAGSLASSTGKHADAHALPAAGLYDQPAAACGTGPTYHAIGGKLCPHAAIPSCASDHASCSP